MLLSTSGRPMSVSLPIAIEPKPGACGRIFGTATRQKLSPLIDCINDGYGRCAIGFGLVFHDIRIRAREGDAGPARSLL